MCNRRTVSWRNASACLCLECFPGCTAMCVVCWRRRQLESAYGEKSRTGALWLQARPDLSCSVTHARPPFLVPVGRDPNHLFQALQAGKLALMPAILRRIHKILILCPASVAAASPNSDAGEQLVPVNGGHRMLIHPSPGCASVRLQLCPRPRPREPASRHFTTC